MSTGVLITLIICGTILAMFIVGTIANLITAEKARKDTFKITDIIKPSRKK